eukprot:6204017-Pleurochrysis_carterae.AAC.1
MNLTIVRDSASPASADVGESSVCTFSAIESLARYFHTGDGCYKSTRGRRGTKVRAQKIDVPSHKIDASASASIEGHVKIDATAQIGASKQQRLMTTDVTFPLVKASGSAQCESIGKTVDVCSCRLGACLPLHACVTRLLSGGASSLRAHCVSFGSLNLVHHAWVIPDAM